MTPRAVSLKKKQKKQCRTFVCTANTGECVKTLIKPVGGCGLFYVLLQTLYIYKMYCVFLKAVIGNDFKYVLITAWIIWWVNRLPPRSPTPRESTCNLYTMDKHNVRVSYGKRLHDSYLLVIEHEFIGIQ